MIATATTQPLFIGEGRVTYDGGTLALGVNPADTTQPAPDGTAAANGYTPVPASIPRRDLPTPLFPFNG